MNIYFLVEGEAELGVYPNWINFLLDSKLTRCYAYNEVVNNQYFIFNAGGFGKMVHHSIRNAAEEITANPVFDWFVVIVDADDQAVQDRRARLETVFADDSFPTLPANCQCKIIVQNRCFETWLCGHKEAFSLAQISQNANIQRFINHYNVSTHDPELMLKDTDPRFASWTLAKYHGNYLTHILLPNRYNKGTAHKLIDTAYLETLHERLAQSPTHLTTLAEMLAFFKAISLLL